MCTVTLMPFSSKNFVLTSNRDEAPGRETLAPEVYTEKGVKMAFPKDVVAGGTWLGISERNRLINLLNGGFKNHVRKPPYRLSRGVVVKELLAAEDFVKATEEFNFLDIEPFTLIVVEWQNELTFAEFVWDGGQKHLKNLPIAPQMWSSTPLYPSEVKKQRETWFEKLQKKENITPEGLLNFHTAAGKGDINNGLIMDRGFVKTRSISQVVVSEEKLTFFYHDLETRKESKLTFA